VRHYATSRKVAGSNPDEVIGFSNWPNPSSRIMGLGSTQPLKEMVSGIFLGGGGVKGGRRVRLTASAPSVNLLSRECGSLDVWQTHGLSRAVAGIALPFFNVTLHLRQVYPSSLFAIVFPTRISHIFHVRYMTGPSRRWFNHRNNTVVRIKIMNLSCVIVTILLHTPS
jgi:hypothetical protein